MAEARRAALITGAGRRIGRAMALWLGGRGWDVAVHYNGSQDAAAEVVRVIEAAGGRAVALPADLMDTAAAEGLIDAAARALGPLRLLVNNASLFEFDDLATLSEASFDRHMAINAKAPLFLARRFATQTPAGADPVIVNVLDQKVFNLNPDFLSYSVGKIALAGLTPMLAQALAGRVRVVGLAPGLTLPSGGQSDDAFARAHAQTPLGRGSTVDDLLQALDFLLATRGYSGQTLIVDAGQHLQPRARDVMFEVS